MAIADPLKEAAAAMDKTVEAMSREFSSVRTGKATPALLDTVRVEAYESKMPLMQVANVSAPEPQMLLVQPYDPNLGGAIANAIRSSDLGLNPSVDGTVVRVPIPPLTEERRKEMVKLLHRIAEEGRVSVRHLRHVGRDQLHAQEKASEISEDDMHRQIDKLQEVTDGHIKNIDALLTRKEVEVMEV
jgi:ribosome recycling factor